MTFTDTTARSQTESISFEFDLHHSPAKVWRALTDPDLLAEWLLPVAEALKSLGSERAWVVHGSDGLDEITLTGPTYAAIFDGKNISTRELTPADFGLPQCQPADLQGGDAAHNASALRDLLGGTPSAYRDIVLANTSAVLNIHGTAKTITDGVARAAHAIDSGAASKTLQEYITLSNTFGGS